VGKERAVSDPARELRDLRAPGETDARRRAWELAAAALPDRPAAAPSARPLRRATLATAAAVALLVAALTPPGSAVADWLGDAVRSVVETDPPPRNAGGLEDLPGGGRVLVLADGAPAIAGDDAKERLVADADAVEWSPHARFVVAVRGNELVALDLHGERRWAIGAPAPIERARWSPDGFRVAYATGAQMRLVAGDGTGDRVVTQRRVRAGEHAFAGLAWRPGKQHVLAYVDRRRVWVVDTDARRVLWSRPAPNRPTPDFSPDGTRLLLTSTTDVRVLRAQDGHTLHRLPARLNGGAREREALRARPGTRLGGGVWNRAGSAFALVRRNGPRTEVLMTRANAEKLKVRRLFVAGDLRVVAFSPDDRWLLVDWTETGTWLFLPVDGGRARQLTDVPRRFGARNVVPLGWCCPP
jgi:dipeptidyl aminopeptidase/acylaminoacyl peptidase